MSRYATTSGPATVSPAEWPKEIPRLSDKRATLLVFAHPQCPCTRATLIELAQIMTEHRIHLDARVYFYEPAIKPSTWSDSGISEDASRLPGVRVIKDVEGELASRFHARTSGQVLFYDSQGHLRFSGGITPSRGHAGYNDGHDAISALLDGKRPLVTRTPVFGCSLIRETL